VTGVAAGVTVTDLGPGTETQDMMTAEDGEKKKRKIKKKKMESY